MSGTIRFITNKPKLTGYDGYVTAEVSNTSKGSGNYDANGAINLPIVDGKLAARVVGWWVDDDGYIDQVRIASGRVNNVNNDRTGGGRGMLRWAPTDELDLVASVTAQKTTSDGSSRYTPPGVFSFGDKDNVVIPKIPGGDLTNTDVTRSPWSDDLRVFSLTGTYRLPSGNITATANQFNRNMDFQFDSTPILISFDIPDPAQTIQPQSRDVQSDEIRYASALDGPVNFVAGGFYQRDKSDFDVQVVRTNADGVPIEPFSPLNEDDALQHPGVGKHVLRPLRSSRYEAVRGIRRGHVGRERRAQPGRRRALLQRDPGQQAAHDASVRRLRSWQCRSATEPRQVQQDHVQGQRELQVRGSPAHVLHVLTRLPRRWPESRGSAVRLGIPNGFEPDELDNFEVGFKGRAGAALEYDVAAYYIDWTNIQVRQLDATKAFPFTGNAGDARVVGLEGSVTARLGEYFTFNVASFLSGCKAHQRPAADRGESGHRQSRATSCRTCRIFRARPAPTSRRRSRMGCAEHLRPI
jgi:hypothetical protein